MSREITVADDQAELPGRVEEDSDAVGADVLVVPGSPKSFGQVMMSPPPRKPPPPPAAYAPPPWLSPPTVDPPFEAPLGQGTPRSYASSASRPVAMPREGITLSQLQEFLSVERCLRRSCRTLPLTLALWISFTLLIVSHGQAQTSFESAQLLREAFRDARVPANGSSRELRAATVAEHEQILQWARGALVPLLAADGLDHGRIGETQQLVGFVRVTQERGVTASCEGLGDQMRRFHGGGCHPPGGTVLAFGPYQQDYAFRPLRGRANRFEAWLEVGRSRSTVQERIRSLESDHWIDLSTQQVVAEAVFLNVQDYVFSHVAMTFTLHREGLIDTNLQVRPLRGEVYPHWGFVLLDAIWIAIIAILALRALLRVRRDSALGLLQLHLRDPFVWVDWVGVLFGLAIGIFFWFFIKELDDFEQYIAQLKRMPTWAVSEAPANRKVQATLDNVQYQEQLSRVFSDFDRLSTMVDWHRFCTFCYTLIIVARFFRGFAGQPRIAVLVQAMLSAADFFLHYLMAIGVVFLNFALGGFILFGERLEGWSTFGRSINMLFMVLFGEFDYDEFHGVAPATAAFWFWSFYVCTALLLVKLLTAAILNRYLAVRERLGEPGASLAQQLADYMGQIWWLRTYDGAQKSIPEEQLLEVISADADPSLLERLSRLGVDRRLRTREDLARAERDAFVDVEFLVKHGCDPMTAERLLDRCSGWRHQMSMTSSPAHRLMLLVARHMTHMRTETERMEAKLRDRIDHAAKAVDRLDLKHAKCAALARRVRKAQELPAGWTALTDEQGRRYLRQEVTGLTSWTLPRSMI
mmetsp:Transcript_470/g.1396  ORF Transcript_470/g.1396 Transcript_470/m.1396 type:complete len:809 (-) Transcript_470:84-2510(-)